MQMRFQFTDHVVYIVSGTGGFKIKIEISK